MTTSPNPLIQVICRGNVVAARVCSPELAEAEARALAREFAALVAGRDRPVVTLDLAAVRYLGSMAVGQVVALNQSVRAAGGRLSLVNLTPFVRKVFAVCRLGRVFDLGADAVVRDLAYHMWETAGHPAGDGTEFWYAAERELTGCR